MRLGSKRLHIFDDFDDLAFWLAGWLPICDGDDQDWLLKSAVCNGSFDHGFEDASMHLSSEGSHAAELTS